MSHVLEPSEIVSLMEIANGRWDSIGNTAVDQKLSLYGLVEIHYGVIKQIALTERGNTHVNYLCNRPLPEQATTWEYKSHE